MKEEQILNKDQAVDLRDGGEEAVQDAGGLEGLEVAGAGAPGGGGEGDDEEVEGDGQTAEVSAEGHDCERREGFFRRRSFSFIIIIITIIVTHPLLGVRKRE